MDIEHENDNTQNNKKKNIKGKKNIKVKPLNVNICRFINYNPSQINSMHFNNDKKILAVARKNILEIWSFPKFVCLFKIPMHESNEIRKILWINSGNNKKLIIACFNGLLIEHKFGFFYKINSFFYNNKF